MDQRKRSRQDQLIEHMENYRDYPGYVVPAYKPDDNIQQGSEYNRQYRVIYETPAELPPAHEILQKNEAVERDQQLDPEHRLAIVFSIGTHHALTPFAVGIIVHHYPTADKKKGSFCDSKLKMSSF
jgi:hypothetical protein